MKNCTRVGELIHNTTSAIINSFAKHKCDFSSIFREQVWFPINIIVVSFTRCDHIKKIENVKDKGKAGNFCCWEMADASAAGSQNPQSAHSAN